MTRTHAMAAALAIALGACVLPASEVLVVLDTNAAPDRTTSIAVTIGTAANPTSMHRDWTHDRTRMDSIDFPASFAIVPNGSAPPGTPLVVQVDFHAAPTAIGDPDVRFTRRARFTITSNRTTMVRMFLPVECATPATGCAAGTSPCTVAAICEAQGLTCGNDATCSSPDVTPEPFDTDAGSTGDIACPAGTHRCGARCADNTSVATCGSSCTPCPAPSNSTATCDGSTCGIACDAGFHLCNGSCLANTSVAACGASCTPCVPPANATATCDGTMCGFQCKPTYDDCDHVAANGCEADLYADPANCGTCGRACPASPNTAARCVASQCESACSPGFTDCNGSSADGCETNNGGSCNPCGGACPPGVSSVPSTCPATCTGGCVGDQCIVDCQTIGGCDGQIINCPTGMRCRVDCPASLACRGTQVICPAHSECFLDCRGSRACLSALVRCPADAPCTADCNGADACIGAFVDCGSGACTSLCSPPTVLDMQCNNSCSCMSCRPC